MPRATTAVVDSLGASKMKSQSPAITLTGISRTLKAMPATPMPLLVSWPMVPATWVPCPSRSTGASSSQMKSRGATNRFGPASSGAAANGMATRPSAG